MATLNTMVFDVLNVMYGGKIPDDADLSERLVAYYIEQYRALLIRQELSTRGKVPENYVQTLGCIPLEAVDKSDCCENTSGCTVLRTTIKLPKIVNSGGKSYIVSVSSADGEVPITMVPFYRAKWNKYNVYTKRGSRGYLKDNYLYVTNYEGDYVSLSAIFESPSELETLGVCGTQACFSWDTEYPITADMASMVTDLILKNRVAIMRQFPKDTTNDMKDEPKAT